MFRLHRMFDGMASGMFAKRGGPPFGLGTLQADPNCVLIQDPSALWGAADYLPRRNLLTSTNLFNTQYTVVSSRLTVPSSSETAPDGSLSAFKVESAYTGTAGATMYKTLSATVTASVNHTLSISVKAGTAGGIRLLAAETSGISKFAYCWFDVINGTVGNSSATTWSFVSASITAEANGFFRCSITFNPTGSITVVPQLLISTTYNVLDVTSGQHLTVFGDSLCLSSTIDQSYQKISAWTTEQYAHAAAKNVPWLRRNIMTYTEGAFNNTTYYTKNQVGAASLPVITDNYADGPFPGSRASRAVFARTGTTATDYSLLSTVVVQLPVGIQEKGSIYVKSNIGADQTFILYGANDSGATPRIFIATTEWQRFYAASNGGPATGRVFVIGTRGGSGQYYTGGDLSLDLQICCAQLEVGSTATPYQRVLTTWDAEYTALAQAAGYPISMYSDAAGTLATSAPDEMVRKMLDLSGDNNHATAPSDAARPVLRLDGNGKWYLYRDLADDNLPISWPANLTTTGEMYVAELNTTTKSTGLTLNGASNYTTPQNDYGRIVMKAPSANYAKITKYLDKKAGR